MLGPELATPLHPGPLLCPSPLERLRLLLGQPHGSEHGHSNARWPDRQSRP
jgi:hypothetical protein